MSGELQQGDILKIEHIRHPVLIVSKNFFNSSGEIIGCPIYSNSTAGPLHIAVVTDEIQGYVQCEKLALLDKVRHAWRPFGNTPLPGKAIFTENITSAFERPASKRIL